MMAGGNPLSRLPENEVELETLVRKRTDELVQYLASIVESSDDAILSKGPQRHHHKLEQGRRAPFRLQFRRGARELMEAMIRHQLRGEIRFDWREEGLACK